MAPLGLHDLENGETGIVVSNHRRTTHGTRLTELGFAHGEPVQMIRQGSPMLVQVGQARLCLRSEDASEIAILRV